MLFSVPASRKRCRSLSRKSSAPAGVTLPTREETRLKQTGTCHRWNSLPLGRCPVSPCYNGTAFADNLGRHIIERNSLGLAVVGSGRIGTLRARLAAGHPAVRYIAVSDADSGKARTLAEKVSAQFH